MNLSAPQVNGPVSICCDSVRVKGQITGATVTIILNGDINNPIGKGTADWSDQFFQFTDPPPGGLQPGDRLTAVQLLGADQSPESPEPVEVQPFDAINLNHVNFLSHLYVCGRHLWLTGLAPGATLEVGPGGSRGSTKAVDGDARLTIDPPIADGETLQVRQVACGQIGPDNFSIEPDPRPSRTVSPVQLRPPRIGKPIYACDRSALVEQVSDGANVTLTRNTVPDHTTGFDISALWFRVIGLPFEDGEEVRAFQAMPNCDIQDSPQSTPIVTVLPANVALPPDVGSPLCEGSTAVLVGGLTPGNRVRILLDGAELVVGEAPDAAFAFSVPPLPAGASITAQEERCDSFGPESAPVIVDAQPADITPPQIVENPLHDCATIIPVNNLHQGSWVRAISGKLGQISPSIYVNTTEMAIPVKPALAQGDEVFVEMNACAGNRLVSSSVPIAAAPTLEPPRIRGPVTSRDSALSIADIVPGAVVEIYRDAVGGAPGLKFEKSLNPGTSEAIVHLGKLKVGDIYNVRQILCNVATPLLRDRDVEVKRPTPLAPTELAPNGGLEEQQPTLSWKDPKEGDADWKADSFDLEISVDGSNVFNDNISANTHNFASALPFSASVTWRVRGRNPSGISDWSEASFDIKPEPGPKGPSKLRVFNCHTDKDDVHIWLLDLTDNTATQKGTLSHQYNQSGSCPAAGSPLDVKLTAGHVYYIVAVDPTMSNCGVNDPAHGPCRRLTDGPYEGDSSGPIVEIQVN